MNIEFTQRELEILIDGLCAERDLTRHSVNKDREIEALITKLLQFQD